MRTAPPLCAVTIKMFVDVFRFMVILAGPLVGFAAAFIAIFSDENFRWGGREQCERLQDAFLSFLHLRTMNDSEKA